MKTSELKIGIKVKAILREDGKHIVVGEILTFHSMIILIKKLSFNLMLAAVMLMMTKSI